MGVNQLVNNIKPKNSTQIRPGRVGSVGDAVVKTRIRQSTPEMRWAYEPYWAGARANKLGSNVQDGNTISFDSKGGSAEIIDASWPNNRDFKHVYGLEIHDIRPPDRWCEPIVSFQGDYSWKTKLSKIRDVKRSGSLFSIKPNGYQPSGMPRGGSSVRVTDVLGGDENLGESLAADPSKQPAPDSIGVNDVRAGISRLGIQDFSPVGSNSVYHPINGLRRKMSSMGINA